MILALLLILHYRRSRNLSHWGNVHKDEDNNNIARNNVRIQTTMSTDMMA